MKLDWNGLGGQLMALKYERERRPGESVPAFLARQGIRYTSIEGHAEKIVVRGSDSWFSVEQ